ncbi:hypothetical protein [Gemmata sp.]|uniref:hypothetical protein n=1 Tax=Gemmata sp. TaxID=1914242 RepID=UPI003F719A0F
MHRFLANGATTLPALIEPVHTGVRLTLARTGGPVGLVVHDWSSIHYHDTGRKKDLYQRSHAHDTGYELAAALVLESATGRPLGPMELRLRTAHAVVSTRTDPTPAPDRCAEELLGAMDAAKTWDLAHPLVHVANREAASVDHDRRWSRSGHTYLVRAGDDDRVMKWNGRDVTLRDLVRTPGLARDDEGRARSVTVGGVRGALWACEVAVVLDRPAKKRVGGRRVEVRGEPLPLRLVVTWVLGPGGEILAEWYLFSNADARFDHATLGQWYAWRWGVESYFKLLKSAGMNAEGWEQHTGGAVAERLVIASTAYLTVWCLQQESGEEAAEVRRVLVRLSGRQMKWGVESTASALLEVLEKLLAVLDLLAEYDIDEIRQLAQRVLPARFDSE